MIFANLTVLENLKMGAYRLKLGVEFQKDLDYIFSIFPRLKERERQAAGTLSGGEQQMLAIGRALTGKPKCLMLDEPSLGIAPILVKTIFEKIVEINQQLGMTILLVEQNANLALEISSRGYVLETGRVILQDTSVLAPAEPAGARGVPRALTVHRHPWLIGLADRLVGQAPSQGGKWRADFGRAARSRSAGTPGRGGCSQVRTPSRPCSGRKSCTRNYHRLRTD